MLTGILLANGSLSASILGSLFNDNLVKEGTSDTWSGFLLISFIFILIAVFLIGVSPAFAVKLFKSWISEKDINSVAGSLRKVGMDNRLMVSHA